MIQSVDCVREVVEATRHWYQEGEHTRFVVQLPEEAILPAAQATLAALCSDWERALLVTDTPMEGGDTVVVTTHTGLLAQEGFFEKLFVIDGRGAYVPLYQQFAEKHLHPFGLAVAYTSHYHHEERRGLTTFFKDGLCYFSEDDTAFINEEMRRGLKFFRMACKDRLDDKVRIHPATLTISAKKAFAHPTFEQDIVWDEIA